MSVGKVVEKKTEQSRNATAPNRPRGRPREFDRHEGLRRAMRLFWAQGYEATSMADLRGALGVTQASLYAAYGSKEALFREAVELYLLTEGRSTTEALSRPGRARDAVHAMLLDGVKTLTTDGAPRGCLIVLGATNCAVENRAVQEYLTVLRRETRQSITGRLREAQARGELGAEFPVASLAGYYATVLHGLSLPARDGATREDLTAVVNLAMAAWPEAGG